MTPLLLSIMEFSATEREFALGPLLIRPEYAHRSCCTFRPGLFRRPFQVALVRRQAFLLPVEILTKAISTRIGKWSEPKAGSRARFTTAK